MIYAIAFILIFGIGRTRKLRAAMWIAQILLGDVIAMRSGKFGKRWLRKRTLRLLTLPTRLKRFL